MVHVARAPGRRIVSVALAVGARLPAWCASMGRVLLADLSPEARAAHLAAADIRPLTPKSLTDRAALAAEIRRCGAQGYALVDEELELGLRSIAAPIRDRAGRTAAALNVSTQASRFPPAEMEAALLPPAGRRPPDRGVFRAGMKRPAPRRARVLPGDRGEPPSGNRRQNSSTLVEIA